MTFTVFTLLCINLFILFLGLLGSTVTKYYKQYIFFQIFIFAFLMGIRAPEVGVDTSNYIDIYLTGNGGYFKELLYKLLGYVLYTIHTHYSVYLLIVSFLMGMLSYCILTNVPVKNEYKPIITWVFLSNVMVVFNWTNGLRQGVASLLILLCIILYSNGKYKRSLLCLLLAPFFHVSSFVFFPFFLFYYASRKMKIFAVFTSNRIYIDMLALVISLFVCFFIFGRIPQFVNKYSFLVSKLIVIKLSIAVVFYGVLQYFFLYHYNAKSVNLFFNLYFYILCVSAAFLFNSVISNRFFYYTGCFEAVLLGLVISNTGKHKKLYAVLLVLGNILYYICTISTSQYAKNFNILN